MFRFNGMSPTVLRLPSMLDLLTNSDFVKLLNLALNFGIIPLLRYVVLTKDEIFKLKLQIAEMKTEFAEKFVSKHDLEQKRNVRW